MPIMYSSHWSASGSLIRRPMRLPVIQKLINYRNHTTLMDMNPLLSPIFLHATSICNCQWDGSCRERTPNERSIQSPRTVVSICSLTLSQPLFLHCLAIRSHISSCNLITQHLIHRHFIATLLKQTRIIAENYKTIDKETKEYCVTVSGMIKQRHSLLITNEMLLQEAQDCQPKKTKNPSGKLVQREVSSKKPRAATDKKSGDTVIDHATKMRTDDLAAPSTPTMWVDQSTVTSNLLTLSSKLLTLSKAYIDTLHCSTSR